MQFKGSFKWSKNLAFLSGKLPVSAYYFGTFGLVNIEDTNDPTKEFGHGNSYPTTDQTRLDVAKQAFRKGKGKRIPSRNVALYNIKRFRKSSGICAFGFEEDWQR